MNYLKFPRRMTYEYGLALLIFACGLAAYIVQTNMLLIPCCLLMMNRRAESNLLFISCMMLSCLLISEGFHLVAQFVFYTFVIIFFSDRYRTHYWVLLNVYSWAILVFFVVCLLAPQNFQASIQDILLLRTRLWPLIWGREINPNFIGMLAFLGVVNFLHRKQYVLMLVMMIFVVFSQSRATLVLVVFFILFHRSLSPRMLLMSLFFAVFLVLFITQSTFADRIQADADNGRFFLFGLYFDELKAAFPFPVSAQRLLFIEQNHGPLDNLYLRVLVDYGLLGFVLLTLPMLFAIKTHLWRRRYEFVLFLSFYLLGLVESAYLNNAIVLVAFAGLLKYSPRCAMRAS